MSATHSCARVTYPPSDLPHSFPFSRSLKPRPPSLVCLDCGGHDPYPRKSGGGSEKRLAMVFSKALDGRGGAGAARRAGPAKEPPPPPPGLSHQLPSPTLQLRLPPRCQAPIWRSVHGEGARETAIWGAGVSGRKHLGWWPTCGAGRGWAAQLFPVLATVLHWRGWGDGRTSG